MSHASERPLTARMDSTRGPLDLSGYESAGGYQGLKKSISQFSPSEIIAIVKDSNLRGRGGAGFPTGVKWSFVPTGENAPKDKYILCNADEMEPGTFKDRLLMEEDPHQLIEGMLIAGYAIGASRGYIFLRGEYVLAAERLNRAIAEATSAGYIGHDILHSGWGMTLTVHTGAGRYICGEETALINSLEGRRANPRAKPPFPGVAGLWGKPTVVNNVETLCNVPHIIVNGAAWFKSLSGDKSSDGGTKIYGVSGRVKRPGCWELPMGTTAREILEEYAGGMADNLELKCWIPGGVSTDFLLPEHLDIPMDFDSVGRAGSRMGTGLMMVIDNEQNIISVLHNMEVFFARESCGWCTPCRDGLPWSVKILEALEQGRGQPNDIEVLENLTKDLWVGLTFCAHAPGAMEPLQSALKFFRSEFEAGIASSAAVSAAA